MNMKIVSVLLIEDDQLDVINMKRNLDKMKIVYSLHVCSNGEEALAYLTGLEKEGVKLPDFVLIDINMPKMNGLELLSVIRHSEKLKHLKCFIITTSEENVDKQAAKNLGVSGYIIKPFKLNNPSSMDSINLMIDMVNTKD
jgi:CheY-like chemotaxis protein